MVKFHVRIAALFCFTALTRGAACGAEEYQALTAITFDDRGASGREICKLAIRDGTSGRPVEGRAISDSELGPGRYEIDWESSDGRLVSRIRVSRRASAVVFRVGISVPESDSAHRLLRVSIAVPLNDGYARGTFWDGLEEHSLIKTPFAERDSLEYTFPVSCVYKQHRGLAVGITPDTLTSSLHSGVTSAKSGSELLYETKVVVDAQHPQTIGFVAYPFTPTFGYLDAVQVYYDLYPRWFKPATGVDSRIYGVGGYISSSNATRRLQLHAVRRTKLNWEWSYAPWVRSGYWYPEESDWREGTDVIRHYRNYRDDYKGTWEEYHAARTGEFSQGNKTCAMFYYILVKELNADLLEQYPESATILEDGQTGGGGLQAIVGEKAQYAFPYGTGLADKLENDVRKVVENYDVSGFAFDMANHALDDYCPAQLKFGAARTFDENGKIYTPDTVPPVLMADRIHKLSRAGKRMGVIVNQAISHSVVFPVLHADAVMYEGGPSANPDNVMPLRLMSGGKPFTFWGNLERGRRITGIRWEYMSDPKAAENITRGLGQHYLLTCLRIGATPMNWAAQDVGHSWLPTLIQLKRAGWNPVPAVTSGNRDLWIGRFGSGMETIFTISNPKRNRIKANLAIFNSYIGPDAYAFVSDQGQPLKQHISSGKTRLTVDLAPKEIMVLRATAIRPKGGEISCVSRRDTATGKVEVAIGTNDTDVFLSGLADNYPNMQLSSVEGLCGTDGIGVNGHDFQIRLARGGRRDLALHYSLSTLIFAEAAEIAAFFTEAHAGDESKICVVVPDKPSRAEQIAAENVEAYYAYAAAYKERPNDLEPGFMNPNWDTSLRVPIIQASQVSGGKPGKFIYIGTVERYPLLAESLNSKEKESVARFKGGFIKILTGNGSPAVWIGGRDSAGLEAAADEYFSLLDGRAFGG